MSQTPIHILKSVDDLTSLTEASQDGPVLLFKHSLTCPISARAQEQFVQVGGAPRYALAVQYARDVSDAVAERFSTAHASPQLLVIDKGEVTGELTHEQVRLEAVEKMLGGPGRQSV